MIAKKKKAPAPALSYVPDTGYQQGSPGQDVFLLKWRGPDGGGGVVRVVVVMRVRRLPLFSVAGCRKQAYMYVIVMRGGSGVVHDVQNKINFTLFFRHVAN